MGAAADLAVYLDVPHGVLVERLLERARTEGRADDTPEVIENRLAVFEEATRPLVDYYRGRGLLEMVDADRPLEDVTADIIRLAEARGTPAPPRSR
jgi:adenylate kinase